MPPPPPRHPALRPPAPGLRVARHRTGPQRARRDPGGRRARAARRARPGLAAGADPACPAHRPRHRPGHRRAHRGTMFLAAGRAAAGPARRRPDRPAGHQSRRDRQEDQPPHATTRVHHRCARCRGATAGRPGGRLPRRPAHHHALRPGRRAWTGTPPTSSPPSSPARRGKRRPPCNPAWPPDDGQAVLTQLRHHSSPTARPRTAVLYPSTADVNQFWAVPIWTLCASDFKAVSLQPGWSGRRVGLLPHPPARAVLADLVQSESPPSSASILPLSSVSAVSASASRSAR